MKKLPEKSSRAEIDGFLKKMAATKHVKPAGPKGRLIFAMDATASREPTWHRACQIQSEMFQSTATLGGLDIQLCYYRGFQEFYASSWVNNPDDLLRQMASASCVGGHTQIGRVICHAIKETKSNKVNAMVFVGDSMEEKVDYLCRLAGELALLGVPVFMFQEGYDVVAEAAFRQIATLTKGAYCRFDANSAKQLSDLLNAVAVYAASGRAALERFGEERGGIVPQLIHQVGAGKG